MREYDHKKIESKWRKKWADEKLYRTSEDKSKPKSYVLDEFPYPSGEGLHTGHTRIYTASDIYARRKRMQGFNVLHPSGWDAFGLPAEQYAIKHKVHPSQSVKKNTERYKEQMEKVGLTYDWEREINTTDPAFYKWTQWTFLKMLERGLAFQSFEPINWCPTCQTGLANEDLDGGVCERCGSAVIKKPMRQWVLRITDYADRLVDDLDTLPEWPEAVKEAQRNWIGRSEGAEFEFGLFGIPGQEDGKHKVKIFTTRPDTLFGVTFVAISAELAKKWLEVGWKASHDVEQFIERTLKVEADRAIDEVPEKEGIFTGLYAENPANKEKVPVWIANYVLSGYGTGALMAVPAHDERDFEFAKKYDLPIRTVIEPLFQKRDGDDAIRADLPIVKRDAVACVIKHWSEDKYLCLKWKNVPWSGFVTGGTDGESINVAGKREILEETGYKNAKFVRALDQVINVQFYHVNKAENRWARFQGAYFELENDEQIPIAEDEKNIADIHWVPGTDVEDFLSVPDMKLIWCKLHDTKDAPYTGKGILSNSGAYTGMESASAIAPITEYAGGKLAKQYKLKDWVFSRQRYWGEPIPVIHCEKDGVVPIPESELPVTLPEVESYAPTGTGESPLAGISDWVNTTCPKCKGPAKRETNTMPQWAGSSWYYLRFMDPHNADALVSKESEKYWAPVDVYVGGAEHVTRHLIYARFWHKFLYDIDSVSTIEPFKRRRGVGLVLGEGGVKMSKRLGNVINPDDIVERFGADTLRLYEMFMGPFGGAIAWSTDNLIGSRRFVERVWRAQEKIDASLEIDKETDTLLHQTIKKVGEDIEGFNFNTAISQLMVCLNHLEKKEKIACDAFETFLTLLAPFAPFVTDEIWENIGHKDSIHHDPWPEYDPSKTLSEKITIAIQVNGKLRDTIEVDRSDPEEKIKNEAMMRPDIVKWLEGKEPKKIIYVPGKIVSIVL